MLVQCLCSVSVVMTTFNIMIICILDAKMQCFMKKESKHCIRITKS